MGGGRGATAKLKRAAKKMVVSAANVCGSFPEKKALVDPIIFDHTISASVSSLAQTFFLLGSSHVSHFFKLILFVSSYVKGFFS